MMTKVIPNYNCEKRSRLSYLTDEGVHGCQSGEQDWTGCDIHIHICMGLGLSEEFRRQCSTALRVRYQHTNLGDLGRISSYIILGLLRMTSRWCKVRQVFFLCRLRNWRKRVKGGSRLMIATNVMCQVQVGENSSDLSVKAPRATPAYLF